MLGLVGLGAIHFFGIALDYLVAAGFVALGLYLFGSLRWIGMVLIVFGTIVGALAYGRSIEAARCISAGELADTKLQLAAARRDLAVSELTAKIRKTQLEELAKTRTQADDQIANWKQKAGRLAADARRCRAATRDDDRRLCALVAGKASGCGSVR